MMLTSQNSGKLTRQRLREIVAVVLLIAHGLPALADDVGPQSGLTMSSLTQSGSTATVVTQFASAKSSSAQSTVPSFRNEVMAVLSRSGCNLGTCHGNQNGKGGLKISLRGQDPETDFITLTRQLAGRRANAMNPDESLLLQKPAMLVPHEGGRRFSPESAEYRLLRDWIAAGMPNDGGDVPVLQQLEVTPEMVTLQAPDQSVTLRAVATFSDQSGRDVTGLAVFESSDPAVQISSGGVVQFATSDFSRRTSITVRYLNQQTVSRVESVPARPEFQFKAPQSANVVDDLVFAQLQRLKINPSDVCDDTTFLRRVFLDVTGLLPSLQKAKEFLASQDPNKRALLIDQLLASSEYVDFQTLRWADLLRVEDKTLDAKGVGVFTQWIRDSVAADKPLNQFTAEIIAARGSTYTEAPSNFYRALRTPEERAESAAQVFLGIRLQCAKCHNHPFDRWTQDDYYGWTNFFARVDYKIVENKRRDENDKHEFNGEQIVLMKDKGEVKNPTTGKVVSPRFLGETSMLSKGLEQAKSDRLQQLSIWLSAPDNERFAATQANRIWFQLMGVGIVDPIDDFRATNPASNPELLDSLRLEFVESNYSVRHLMRLILKSRTYQLSSEENETNRGDETMFSHAVPRRLTAEQTLDAVAQVLQAPAQFGGHPKGTRAVQMTGVRNGGNRYSKPENGDRFLALFGKPSRLQTCECERTGETTLAQTMEMVSGELVADLLRDDQNCVAQALSSDLSNDEFISQVYWSALSRAPLDEEQTALRAWIDSHGSRRTALQDVAWAVMNSNEFLLRR